MLIKIPALSPMLCGECHVIFNMQLDKQEKARLVECLISHLEGATYQNASPHTSVCVHLAVDVTHITS